MKLMSIQKKHGKSRLGADRLSLTLPIQPRRWPYPHCFFGLCAYTELPKRGLWQPARSYMCYVERPALPRYGHNMSGCHITDASHAKLDAIASPNIPRG